MEAKNKALITVTFYFGDGEKPLFRLNKKYIVQKWSNETELRKWLDEIATEMSHLSGYGIYSIKVDADKLKFSNDYRDIFLPYNEEPEIHINSFWFRASLKFPAGEYYGKSKLHLEIPRFDRVSGYMSPVQMYKSGDKLFNIRLNTNNLLSYDYDNPFLVSFAQKIATEILIPQTKTPYKKIPYTDVENYIKRSVSWSNLPKSQTTSNQIKKNRKLEEKRKQTEERKKWQHKKSGVVYKDKRRKKKAQQVYIIQMVGDGLERKLYKIGISHTPEKRLQSLNTSSPFKLKMVHKFVATSAEEAEAKLHEKYDKYRMNGEWFHLSSKDIAELKKITEYSNREFIKK